MSKTTFDLARELNITPRQLDHWCRRGFIPGQELSPGSGHHRVFSDEQVTMLTQMSVLVRGGFVPAKAAELVQSGEAAALVIALSNGDTVPTDDTEAPA